MKDADPLWHDKLLLVLHTACSEIRRFLQIAAHQRARDLADTIEFIPELMLHWRPECRGSIREALRRYQEKYTGSGFDYLSLLDMSEAAFTSCYLAVGSDGVENGDVQDIRA
jgi:hypothetical protein